MCELQLKLVAWLDGELPPADVALVARHLESCDSCRRQCETFQRLGESVRDYTDAVLAADPTRRFSRRVPIFASAALLIFALLFAALSRKGITPPPTEVPVATSNLEPVPARGVQAVAERATHRQRAKRAPAPVRMFSPSSPAETAVEIAIPAEDIFAPGALPPGTNFFAELSVAPDGSIRQVRLRQ